MSHLALRGHDHELRYTWPAIRRLREEHAINVLDLVGGAQTEEEAVAANEQKFLDPWWLTRMLWAGCLHDTPTLTLDEVDTWLELRDIGPVGTAIATALQAALQQP